MAETHINTNKLDYQIIAPYTRSVLPDNSVIYLKYREDGENTLKLRPSSWRGEYTITAEYKRVSLERIITIKRTSTNRYYVTYCEVGIQTQSVVLCSMTEVNEFLRQNAVNRLDRVRNETAAAPIGAALR